MKRWVYIVGTILLVAFAGFWTFQRTQSRKTEYAGRDLSFWLSVLIQKPPGGLWPNPKFRDEQTDEAGLAVYTIGTNAFPILIKWVKTKDTPWKTQLATFLRAHPSIPLRIYTAREKLELADAISQVLGPRLKPIVPELVEAFEKGGRDTRMEIASMFQRMGSVAYQAHPALEKFLRSQKDSVTNKLADEEFMVVTIALQSITSPR